MIEATEIIINELKTLPTFQRTVFRQLLKKTYKMIYSIDFDLKVIYFKMESETKVLLEKKFNFKETVETKGIDTDKIKKTGTNVFEFGREEIKKMIEDLK